MVSLTYHIRPAGKNAFEADSRSLLIEAGIGSLSILLWDKTRAIPEAAEVFSGISDCSDQWEEIMQQSELLGYRSLDTIIFLNYPRFLPVPAVFYKPSEALVQMDAFFGEEKFLHTGGDILRDLDMVIGWQVPKDSFECMAEHFDAVQFKSISTLMLENGPVMADEAFEGHLLVSGQYVWVAVWRNGQLLIIKSIPAGDTDNIAYQMLNICGQWGIPKDKIHWRVTGMVQQDSPMWKAAGRFFLHFFPYNTTGVFGTEIPPHFFAHQIQYLNRANHT
jgi:hypothetical protein